MSIINLLIDEYESRVKKSIIAKNEEMRRSFETALDFDQDAVIPDHITRPISVDNCCASASKGLVSF